MRAEYEQLRMMRVCVSHANTAVRSVDSYPMCKGHLPFVPARTELFQRLNFV